MAETTWDAVQREFWQLYQSGAYGEALDLVVRNEALFPRRSRFFNWKMCMAARAGDVPLALQTFQELVDAGLWFGRASLREDEALEPLQGLPEFERLAAICEQRFAAAAAQAAPQLLTVEPEHAAPPYPLLLALHGNSSNLEESERYWRSAAERGWLVALPQSSQAMGEQRYGWNDHSWAVREIKQHAAAILAGYPIDQSRRVVAGFSMGGGLAAWLALSGELDVCGFIGAGPFLANVDSVRPLIEGPRARPLRTYLIASQRDEYCYMIAQQLATLLPPHGIPCQLELHPDLGHAFPPEFERSLIKGLDFING